MRVRSLVVVVVVVASAAPAWGIEPEREVPTYGEGGRVPIAGVAAPVGVGDVVSDAIGRVAVPLTGDPEAGSAVVVSPAGDAVTVLDLGGPGTVLPLASGSTLAVSDAGPRALVSRFGDDGSLDATFGTSGSTAVGPTDGFRGDVSVDAGGRIVVVGGVLGDDTRAWAARLSPDGTPDPSFGDDGLVEIPPAGSNADLVVATDVHVTSAGYLVVTLTRSLEGDAVGVVGLDAGGSVLSETSLSYADEIFSTGSVMSGDTMALVVQTTSDDVDAFRFLTFRPDGTRDASPGATFADDEVASEVYLDELRTGELLLAYGVGPDPAYVMRVVHPDGSEDTDQFTTVSGTWIYGMTALSHDGSIVVAVDETPSSSTEPDDLTLVKVVGDDSGRFVDDDDSVHAADIEALADLGVTRGCDPPQNAHYCPDDGVTRAQMAAFLTRALDLPQGTGDPFTDDDVTVFEADIAAIASAGITKGCNPPANDRFCPDGVLSRGEMAAFLTRALDLPQGTGDPFTDDDASVFEADIAAIAAAGITKGCNPPTNDRFCPDHPVTRGQMASFLVRSLRGR